METTDTREQTQPLPILWATWFIAILAWGLQLFVSYGFIEWACQNPDALTQTQAKWLLNGFTLVCAAAAAYGTWLAYSVDRRSRHASGAMAARSRFMARGGLLISSFLCLTILVQGWPNLVLPLCSH